MGNSINFPHTNRCSCESVNFFLRQKMSRPEGDSNPQPLDSCWMFSDHLSYQGQTFAVPCFWILEVKLTFEMLTMRGQQHSFSTHKQMFLWKCFCCLTAPSHYLNHCWLIISKILWFHKKYHTKLSLKIIHLKIHSNRLRGQCVNPSHASPMYMCPLQTWSSLWLLMTWHLTVLGTQYALAGNLCKCVVGLIQY